MGRSEQSGRKRRQQVSAKQVAHEAGEEYKRTHPDDPRSEDQLGAIHLYSQGWPDAEKSLYAVLNATLSNANRELLKAWFLFIKLLMTALAFEIKNRIYHMLEHSRAGNGAFLRNVSDDKQHKATFFSQAD